MAFFSSLYETFIGANGDYPEYRESIFSSVGLITIVIGLVLALIFYVALGRWRPVWDKRGHWVLTLVLGAILGFTFAYTQTIGTIGASDSYTTRFAIFNALFAALYFVIFSLLLKRFSIFARHTPVKF